MSSNESSESSESSESGKSSPLFTGSPADAHVLLVIVSVLLAYALAYTGVLGILMVE